jgi:hypothetical protein
MVGEVGFGCFALEGVVLDQQDGWLLHGLGSEINLVSMTVKIPSFFKEL